MRVAPHTSGPREGPVWGCSRRHARRRAVREPPAARGPRRGIRHEGPLVPACALVRRGRGRGPGTRRGAQGPGVCRPAVLKGRASRGTLRVPGIWRGLPETNNSTNPRARTKKCCTATDGRWRSGANRRRFEDLGRPLSWAAATNPVPKGHPCLRPCRAASKRCCPLNRGPAAPAHAPPTPNRHRPSAHLHWSRRS